MARSTARGLFFDEIVPLGEETLRNCFQIPAEGVKVSHIHWHDEIVVGPLQEKHEKRFTRNNGKVVFRNEGKTYVAKGYGILKTLEAAGFEEGSIWVPLSNGEEILDPDLKTHWESLAEF